MEKAFSLETFAPPNWDWQIGLSHLLLRQYDKALSTLHRAAERAPKFAPAYVLLACTYVELDRLDDARGAIKTILDIAPQYSLSRAPIVQTHKNEDDRNRFLDSLRKAGLPEG